MAGNLGLKKLPSKWARTPLDTSTYGDHDLLGEDMLCAAMAWSGGT